tara:strand:+ start:231 stop:773 length:543 start_codon:yes stop_codon:yes gene_type:complete
MQKDNTEEEVKLKVYWQWIKGDESGNIVTFKDEGPVWIKFNEGGRIATELRDEFLQILDSDIAGEFVNSNTGEIDPLNIGGSQLVINTKNEIPTTAQTSTSPIRVLFNKQKKNSKVKLVLDFPVNIPTKGIYELMSTSFDSDEVNEELKSFILDQLSQDEILDCLHDSVQSLIEGKYKAE